MKFSNCGQTCGHGRFLTTSFAKILSASASVSARCGPRLFPSWMRPARSQITCATNCATPGYKMIITVVKHVVNSNCQSVRGGDLSVPCLSYFTKLQSNVKPSLYGRSWFQTVQLQRQTRRYTSPGDNSKDSPPSRTPLLHTGRMPLHKSTS